MCLPYFIKLSKKVWELKPDQDFGFRVYNYKKKESESCLSCMQKPFWSLSMPPPNIIKIFQTINKLCRAQEFGLEIHSGKITRKRTEQRLSFLLATLLLDLIYVPTIFYQIISNSMGVMACTGFQLQWR